MGSLPFSFFFPEDAIGSDLMLDVDFVHCVNPCGLFLQVSRRPWPVLCLILFIYAVYRGFGVTCVLCGINGSLHLSLIHFFHHFHVVASVRPSGWWDDWGVNGLDGRAESRSSSLLSLAFLLWIFIIIVRIALSIWIQWSWLTWMKAWKVWRSCSFLLSTAVDVVWTYLKWF